MALYSLFGSVEDQNRSDLEYQKGETLEHAGVENLNKDAKMESLHPVKNQPPKQAYST